MASNCSDADAALNVVQFDPARCLSQEQSPLFSIIPGELRNSIFYFALMGYEDKSRLYDMNTCYRRPGYFAPHRTDTALLLTCQRIYNEAWHLPWTNAVHTLFLTSPERAPPKRITANHLRKALSLIHSLHGEVPVDHLHVFAQLYALEQGDRLQPVLNTPHFNPICITLTIRHTDWWWWENDSPLRIDSTFVNKCRFPTSVKRICLELESIERRKGQIDFMAAEMAKKWCFMRKDGTALKVREGQAPEVMRWTGSSTWNGSRWLADEARPEELDYYVLTVSFTPVRKTKQNEDNGEEEKQSNSPSLEVLNVTPSPLRMNRSIQQSELRRAGIPVGTPATEAMEAYENFKRAARTPLRARRRPVVTSAFLPPAGVVILGSTSSVNRPALPPVASAPRSNTRSVNHVQSNAAGFGAAPGSSQSQIAGTPANATAPPLPPHPRLPGNTNRPRVSVGTIPRPAPPHSSNNGPRAAAGVSPPPLPQHPRRPRNNSTPSNEPTGENTPDREPSAIRRRLRSWIGDRNKQPSGQP